jgi:hypothetical protein
MNELIDRWTLLGKNFYGAFHCIDPGMCHEIVSIGTFDIDGLPERWVKIVRGESGWIPKIVFKIKNIS